MSDAQPITGCRPGDIAEHAFVCGDPARVDRITSRWDSRREVANIREYTIFTGEKDGVARGDGQGGEGCGRACRSSRAGNARGPNGHVATWQREAGG